MTSTTEQVSERDLGAGMILLTDAHDNASELEGELVQCFFIMADPIVGTDDIRPDGSER